MQHTEGQKENGRQMSAAQGSQGIPQNGEKEAMISISTALEHNHIDDCDTLVIRANLPGQRFGVEIPDSIDMVAALPDALRKLADRIEVDNT